MNYVRDAWAFVTTGEAWAGDGGIGQRIGEHLAYTLLAVVIAVAIGLPVGLLVGHTRKGTGTVIAFTGALRALPSLGLLTWLTFILPGGIALPVIPATVVLLILGIPPILAATTSGVSSIPPAVVDAARAMGHSEQQIISRVELPLAAPTIIGGLRSCVLQVLATATICAYISLGGLGRYLLDGLAASDYAMMLVGAFLVTALALAADIVLAGVQRAASPKVASKP